MVTDGTGAALPGAAVTLHDQSTAQVRSTRTDSVGSYSFNALTPSSYTLEVEAPGFSVAHRTEIALSTQDSLTLDVALLVGETNTVQVSTETPLIDSSTASVSTDLSQRRLEDISILGRNPFMTAKVSGVFVSIGTLSSYGSPTRTGRRRPSIAGGPIAANLYLIDGVPITDTNNRPIVIPTIELIQDVKVQANTYDAQVGRTGGGVFNTLLRSGSNTFHGSLFGATRQTAWLANDFFANREGISRPDSPYYNLGASLGGFCLHSARLQRAQPDVLLIGTEGYIQTSPYTQGFVVPTALERTGDFSESATVLYNPNDTYADASGIHRRSFAGNRIPAAQLSTVGNNIAGYYPLPETGNNFTGTDNVRDHAQEVTVKLDQQIRPWWNVNGSYLFYEALQPLGNPLGTLPGSYSYTYHRQVDATQVNSTWILNLTTVLTARYGNNRFPNLIAEVSIGFNPAQLGFPTSLTSKLQAYSRRLSSLAPCARPISISAGGICPTATGRGSPSVCRRRIVALRRSCGGL